MKKRKIGIIIGIIVLMAAIVAIVFIIDKDDKRVSRDTLGYGVTIEGKFYEFSLKEGVEDFIDINDGIACFDALYNGCLYQKDGSKEIEQVSYDGNIKCFYDEFSSWSICQNNKDIGLGAAAFIITDFETKDGITEESSENDVVDAGYLFPADLYDDWRQYVNIYTEDGTIDWSKYEAIYEEIIESKSFSVISDYENFDRTLSTVEQQYYLEDDVEGLLKEYETYIGGVEPKDRIMFNLALADYVDKLSSGEVDYFFIQYISCYDEEDNIDNLLSVRMYMDIENAEKLMEAYSLKLEEN